MPPSDLQALVLKALLGPIPTQREEKAMARCRVWAPEVRSGTIIPAKVLWVAPELMELFPEVEVRHPSPGTKPRTQGIQGWVSGMKVGRPIRAFSRLEKKHIKQLEVDHGALWMVEQPARIAYMEDGAWRNHIPDAFVFRRYGSVHEFHEVKYEKKAAESEKRWEAIGQAIAALGFRYEVVTERTLAGVRASNTALFFQDRHVPLPEDHHLQHLAQALASGPLPVSHLEQSFAWLNRRQVHALIRQGFLAFPDLDQAFEDQSLVVLGGRPIRRIAASFRKVT